MAENTVKIIEQPLNIYQKLAKIRRPVEILQKNKSGYGYKYVTEDVILSKITGLMATLGVSLIPNIIPGTTVVTPYAYSKTKVLKDGKIYEEKVNEILTQGDMEWHWVNNDNPEDRIIVPWAMVGQQTDASQAFGSGLSYASRYFMLKYFNVATSEDDPDQWRAEQKEAEDFENRTIASDIVAQVNTIVQTHLEKNPDDRKTVTEVVKQFARTKDGKASANYNEITDPTVAANLLTAVREKFGAKSK